MSMNPLLIAGAAGLILLGANSLRAQDTTAPPTDTPPAGDVTTPPVTTPDQKDKDKDKDKDKISRDLKNAPPEVQKLVQGFETTREKYLTQQKDLLAQLKEASAEQRATLREQLVANRESFMAELKTFRQQFQADLAALKPKLSRPEMRRIIDAAKDASQVPSGSGHTRKGR
jgi:hypothetical protein